MRVEEIDLVSPDVFVRGVPREAFALLRRNGAKRMPVTFTPEKR